ncbi:MAG: UDP-glucose 4-epimerase [Solirubrobacteraceae bacterium]|nr:UDP-glucose 4-epimerase [Solirubrobacteraceae bacterium]
MLGAGYLGAACAERALRAGEAVTLADDWSVTERWQVNGLEEEGAAVRTVDIRDRAAVDAVLAETRPDRVLLLAAQASRPIADREPDRTEEINILGVRRVAEAVARAGVPSLVFGSSLHVYGPGLSGEIGPEHPYGPQGDLAHLSKVYGELSLRMHAERHGFALALLRLAIIYGPSPVEHSGPDSVTVVDKFRRMAAAGEPLTIDGGGRATIGVVHVADAARICVAARPEGVTAANVVAETITVADVAALAEGREPAGDAGWSFATPYAYEHRVADYLRR